MDSVQWIWRLSKVLPLLQFSRTRSVWWCFHMAPCKEMTGNNLFRCPYSSKTDLSSYITSQNLLIVTGIKSSIPAIRTIYSYLLVSFFGTLKEFLYLNFTIRTAIILYDDKICFVIILSAIWNTNESKWEK